VGWLLFLVMAMSETTWTSRPSNTSEEKNGELVGYYAKEGRGGRGGFCFCVGVDCGAGTGQDSLQIKEGRPGRE
jgi:hypothetical protein